MRNVEINRQCNKLNSLIKEVESSFEPDDELCSHFAKYICVLTSGLLENAVYFVYSDYAKLKTHSQPLLTYLDKSLKKVLNPNTQKLYEIAESFNTDWKQELKEFLTENGRAEAINYIITDRHKIAHGKDSDITINRIKGYLQKAVEVIEFIENQCFQCKK